MPWARSRSSRMAASSCCCRPWTISRARSGLGLPQPVGAPEVDGEGGQPLLCPVVQVALDGAPRLEGGLRQPRSGLLQLARAPAQAAHVVAQPGDEDEHDQGREDADEHGPGPPGARCAGTCAPVLAEERDEPAHRDGEQHDPGARRRRDVVGDDDERHEQGEQGHGGDERRGQDEGHRQEPVRGQDDDRGDGGAAALGQPLGEEHEQRRADDDRGVLEQRARLSHGEAQDHEGGRRRPDRHRVDEQVRAQPLRVRAGQLGSPQQPDRTREGHDRAAASAPAPGGRPLSPR